MKNGDGVEDTWYTWNYKRRGGMWNERVKDAGRRGKAGGQWRAAKEGHGRLQKFLKSIASVVEMVEFARPNWQGQSLVQ